MAQPSQTPQQMNSAVTCYPFKATRTQVWRRVTSKHKDVHPSVVKKLPETATAAKCELASMSNQQALAVRYLRNSMAVSYAASGIAVFHLGGLPGAGKTAIVKELIAELNDSKLIDTDVANILLCSKSNSAKTSLMSECETSNGTSLLYPANSFATLNSGFSIPVVHNRNEVTCERVNNAAGWLVRKVLDSGLGNLQFLVIDEYTMSSCREIVYIDAILRMVKFRPDVPFGGVFVLLLGDNRQNSAVVEDNNNGMQINRNENKYPPNQEQQQRVKQEEEEEEGEGGSNMEGGRGKRDHQEPSGFRAGGVEDDFNSGNAKLYTDLFVKILRSFASKSCFGDTRVMKKTISSRLEVLLNKEQNVTSTNNDVILAHERNSPIWTSAKEEMEEWREVSSIDSNNGSESYGLSCDVLSSNEQLRKVFSGDPSATTTARFDDLTVPTIASKPTGSNGRLFSSRCKRIAEANLAFKRQTLDTTSMELEPGTMGILKDAPLSAVVEEGLKSEIDHLSGLQALSASELESYTRYIFNEIIVSATKAMNEIDYSGREKLYIVSSLSERFSDAHVTSLMDEEILNAKLLYGYDQKCCDALPFRSAQNRSMAISACVKNAFVREGLDKMQQIPIAKYFKANLKELGAFLSDSSLCYKNMLEKSVHIKYQLEQWKINDNDIKEKCKRDAGKTAKPQQRHRHIDGSDEDDDQFLDDDTCGMMEEGYFDRDEVNDEVEKVVSRPDAPEEVSVDSTTSERVGTLVDFHVFWYNWLSDRENRPSDLVRSRLWHLYTLVRMQQVGFSDGEFPPSFDRAATSGRLFFSVGQWKNTLGEQESNLHEEFWLRALSMPVSSGGDTRQSLLLPAYSSYLSAVSRTYIMSSLKRVNAVKHAYALMYGLSLLDMTVDVNQLVDSRKVPCLNLPIGYSKEFCVEEYFGSIFPSIVDEFLMHRPDDVMSEARAMEDVCNSLKVTNVIGLANHLNHQATSVAGKHIGNGVRYTKKSVFFALRMLTSISKGNIRSKLSEGIVMDGNEGKALANKRLKVDGNTSVSTTSLADRFSAKVDEKRGSAKSDVDRMMGAVALTRSHAQKNAVSSLVDACIINESGITSNDRTAMNRGVNSVKATRSDTKFIVKNTDVSYLSHEKRILPGHKGKILEAIRQMAGKPFIDSITDARLLREAQSPRTFTKILTDLRNKVTRAKSVILYQGQNVVFTNTNVRQIHGAPERFVTKDTGVVTDIAFKNGVMTVSVLVERLGKHPLQLTEGRHFLGSEKIKGDMYGGPQNAFVHYIPLESSQAMTIYSCQGQTFCRDTIVDLTNASTQDAYVAVTRNSDPLNLYVLQTHETERKNLSNIKHSMGKDRASLLPLGGVGKLGGEEFVNYDAINVSMEVLGAVASSGEKEEHRLYSTLNPTNDTVTAAQRFIMNRSGNALAFNFRWMAKTAEILREDGKLDTELNRISEFFFGKGEAAKEYAKYYTDTSHDKLMELFTAVTRSVTHYCMSGVHVRTPSTRILQDHVEKHKNMKDYVKIHPSFLNAPPLKDSLSALFFDVAPHTKAAAVLQFYAHYLFLVYEQLHICNSSFAFLPSPWPVLNHHTRPDLNERRGKPIELPVSCAAHIPGGGLGYESDSYASSVDGGSRREGLRMPITSADHMGDNIDALRKSALSSLDYYNDDRATECTEHITKFMRHNLRRTGKFCRPKEACGLSKHGAIVAATNSERVEHSHIHQSDKGWISLSNEANMYGLLIFMTKLAAASGVYVDTITDKGQLEPKNGMSSKVFVSAEECGILAQYQLKLSEEVLWCGKVSPMFRVQFTLHARSRQSVKAHRIKGSRCGRIFSHRFGREILKGKTLRGLQVLMITEMLGHEFAQHSTSKIRSSIFHGAGKVVARQTIEGGNTAIALEQLEQFVVSKLQQPLPCARAAFFVTCSYDS